VFSDENAFGVLASYFAVEDDEYGLEPAEFAERFEDFRAAVRGFLVESPLGPGARGIDLGHAFYVEIGDGDQAHSPLSWAKRLRAALTEAGFETVVAVTHGSRWVDAEGESPTSSEFVGDFAVLTVSNPSEPLRRALYADTACQSNDEVEGWGTGLYLDTEAAEALSLSPKNAPTVLSSGGAGFYRAGR
jgi:hypothetical protein